jgi:CRP/FNR family cyclic AMP-dependent transcriptional regulator
VVRLSGQHRHFTSSKVKTTPGEAASDAFSWRTGMSTDVTDVLRTTDLLGSAPAADLEAIAAASRSRTFRRGQILFTAGDPGNTLIVVISGRVKVVVRSADGGELTLTVIAPGGVFGQLSVADGGPRSADAEALEDCRLLFVPREVIMDLCGRAPSVAQALASSLAASLRRLTEEASDLVFLDLPRRVAKVLRRGLHAAPRHRQPSRIRVRLHLHLHPDQIASTHITGTHQR